MYVQGGRENKKTNPVPYVCFRVSVCECMRMSELVFLTPQLQIHLLLTFVISMSVRYTTTFSSFKDVNVANVLFFSSSYPLIACLFLSVCVIISTLSALDSLYLSNHCTFALLHFKCYSIQSNALYAAFKEEEAEKIVNFSV